MPPTSHLHKPQFPQQVSRIWQIFPLSNHKIRHKGPILRQFPIQFVWIGSEQIMIGGID